MNVAIYEISEIHKSLAYSFLRKTGWANAHPAHLVALPLCAGIMHTQEIIRQNDSDFFLFIFQETSDVSFFHISGKDKRKKSQLSSKEIGKIDLEIGQSSPFTHK